MGRSRVSGTEIDNIFFGAGFRFKTATLALSGTLTMQDGGPPLLFIDPNGGAKTVKLPPNPKLGETLILVNTADAAEVITVQDSGGNALVPACTPTQNEIAFLFYAGSTLGWRSAVALGA